VNDLAELGLPLAPQWSLQLGQLGKSLVILGTSIYLLAAVASLFSIKHPKLWKVGPTAFWIGTACLASVFAILISLFVTDQFHFEYVRARSMVDSAAFYKVAGVWSGQQGSFILWGVASALFGLLTLRAVGNIYRPWYLACYSVFLAFICAIVAFETPFNILNELVQGGKTYTIPDGVGLTPALQNLWMVIHPPIIFLGFGSLTILACWAVAAMASGNLTDWVPAVRPWAILSATILGLGLCLGGFWAYETLGWGGFWAWDPVENVSFVPWVLGIALIHGLIVQAARQRWVWTNLLLAGLPFLFFVYGTFLTRSGVFGTASVHSFVSMDRIAYRLLLGFLILSTIGFLALWLLRGRSVAKNLSKPSVDGIHRENAYLSGVLMLSATAAATAIGMSIPAITVIATGQQRLVNEQNYHQVLAWVFVPLMIAMAAGPFLSWKPTTMRELFNRMFGVLCVSLGLVGIALFILRDPNWGVHMSVGEFTQLPFGLKVPRLPWITFLLFICTLAAVGNAWRISEVVRKSQMQTGPFLSHLGVAVLMAGMILSRGLERSEKGYVIPGATTRLLDFTLEYQGHTKLGSEKGILDRDNKVMFKLTNADRTYIAKPGLYYTVSEGGEESEMVWPHIDRQITHDTYLTLYKPVTNVWEQPHSLKEGESKTENEVTLTYDRFEMEGEPGQPGTKFKAYVTITARGETFKAQPYLELTGHGVRPEIVPAGSELSVVMPRIEAKDQSASFQILLSRPAYPVELFYKPMTGLVWGGTGIMVLGGFLSAWSRRFRRREEPAATLAA
jgi:cytochrome c-type biogenesis protein CcmF